MTTLDLDRFAADNNCTTNERLVFLLRQIYNTASMIASLISTKLVSADPERVAYCDREMAWFFDDLGNCFQDSWEGVRNALSNGARLATHPTTGDMRGAYAGLPAIVLGAGPGAADRLDAIKDIRGHAVLIVCDVMLGACLERGIVPDFVSAQERLPLVYESMQGLDKTGITLLAPMVVERRVVDDFAGRVVWCWRGCLMETWVDDQIQRNNFGRSCGVQGISAALLAGCNPVYLAGHDLCMQGDQTHANGAHELTQQTTVNISEDSDEYHQKRPAKSISGRDVVTTHLWGMFKSDIEHIIQEHPQQLVINTGDGLPIKGTLPGELLPEWTMERSISLPVFTRKKPGNNPLALIQTMLSDIPQIEKRCQEVLSVDAPSHESLRLTTMVDHKTAGVWCEIYGSTYASALIRVHLQPSQHIAMLKRTANTILHTLPRIRAELEAIT